MRVAIAAAFVAVAVAATGARAADPDALWNIISRACIPHTTDGGGGKPCETVDLARGYVLLKDRNGATQFLVMPTARVAGIESPELLAPGALPYWADAWAARSFVSARAGREMARDEIGLAINSAYGRSQNQLHIHIDCIRPDVRAALLSRRAEIGSAWAAFAVPFDGHTYQARRIAGDDLDAADPFRLLAEGDAQAGADMSRETLVLTGATFAEGDGFILLADRAGAAEGDRASGEELLDHACALARPHS